MESNNKLERMLPSELGIKPSSILKMIEQWEKNGGMNSFMLLRRGKVAAEGWWKPYSDDKCHMLFSLSKSFTSIASAFAVAEGLIDYEDAVISFFPEYVNDIAELDERMPSLKIKHLLSMTTGHEPSADFIFGKYDCVKAFLESKLGHDPGYGFSYNTGATYMVSAIVQKVTGQRVVDYLKPRLFEPLGIEGISWDECDHGISYGGFGLNVKTEDIAKFGQFILQRGMWNGVQLLSAELIDAAASKHINNWGDSAYKQLDDFKPEEQPDDVRRSDWAQGYGRQFWRCVPDGVFRGDGAFGQLCVIMPKYDVVIACTAGLGDMQAELNAIWDNINDDAFGDEVNGEAIQAELDEKLSSLTIPLLSEGDNTEISKYSGIKYDFSDDSECHINAISIEIGNAFDKLVIEYKYGEISTIYAGHGKWSDNEYSNTHSKNKAVSIGDALSSETPESDDKYASYSACCNSEGVVYTVKAVQNLTPFIQTYTLTFDGDWLHLKLTNNVGGGDGEWKGCIKK